MRYANNINVNTKINTNKIGSVPSINHIAYYADLKEWVMIEIDGSWYQCSDYYKWHSQMYLKPKDAVQLTRDSTSLQKLGSGWMTVPANP